jgi:hypothetical protein
MSGTKVHSNYEDLITFTRASAGHALRPVSYGTELVENGTFDSNIDNWTAAYGAVLSHSSGQLVIRSNGIAYQVITTEVGK